MQHESSEKKTNYHTDKTNKWKEVYASDPSEDETDTKYVDQASIDETVSSLLEKEDNLEEISDSTISREMLFKRLKIAEEKAEQATQKVQYAAAEMQTARHLAAQREKFLIEKELKALLPVMDSLDTCKMSLNADISLEKLEEGVSLILKLMSDVFEKWGVVPIQPVFGDAFDPNCHIVMSVKEVEEQSSGTILELLQKGYCLHDRVIRPAMVVVNK